MVANRFRLKDLTFEYDIKILRIPFGLLFA